MLQLDKPTAVKLWKHKLNLHAIMLECLWLALFIYQMIVAVESSRIRKVTSCVSLCDFCRIVQIVVDEIVVDEIDFQDFQV